MILKIKNEQVWQLLSDSMTIGPSPTGYDLQVGADSKNFTTLFSVGANTPRMVTNVANGSYFRMKNNVGDVEVNWQRTCAGGGGGGGADYTPGQYIDIQNNVISVTGITPDEYLTTADTQDFATKEFVTGATSPIQTQLDDIERVTATALTELHQDILDLSGSTSEFVTSGDVATQISAATQGLATEEEISAITSMMETKEEVIAAALVDLDGRIPDMSDYYTSAQTQNAITAATQGFVTSGDVATQISTATANMVESTTVSTIWTGTQAQYDLIANPDPNTLYIIKNN